MGKFGFVWCSKKKAKRIQEVASCAYVISVLSSLLAVVSLKEFLVKFAT